VLSGIVTSIGLPGAARLQRGAGVAGIVVLVGDAGGAPWVAVVIFTGVIVGNDPVVGDGVLATASVNFAFTVSYA
jgi:tetrahydrodipicolinate N-succinyltransferase